MRGMMKCRRGATAVEYSLIAALISIVAIASMQATGQSVSNLCSMVDGVIAGALR